MKIPKYIEKELQKQQISAEKANIANIKVHRWLEKKGVRLNGDNIYSENSIMLITEPSAYANGIRKIIEEI